MRQPILLEAGLELSMIYRRAARFFPEYVHGATLAVPVLQVEFMNHVAAVNDRHEGLPMALREADRLQLCESAAELEAAIRGADSLGIAVRTDQSGYTNHDRLVAEYGSPRVSEDVDVLRFTQDAVTGAIVQPRHTVQDDTYDPQINLRVMSDHDPLLTARGDDGQFRQVPSPGRWYKFPLDAVLVAGIGYRETGQQI